MAWSDPAAGEVVGEGEEEHKKEPDEAGEGGEVEEAIAPFQVHEEEDDEHGLANGDDEREREVEDAEVHIAEAPGDGEQEHEPAAVCPVVFWWMHFFHQRWPAR